MSISLCFAFVLCGCASNRKNDNAMLSPKKALAEADSVYEKNDTVKVMYIHEITAGDDTSGYYATVIMDKVSGTSHAEVNQSLSNRETAVFESACDLWTSDTGRGSRYYYIQENTDAEWNKLSKHVPATLFESGNIAGYLLDQNTQGYIAVDAYYKNGMIIATAKVNDPLFMTIEPAYDNCDDTGKWDVNLELNGITKNPISATFTKGNETIILRYSEFNIEFEPSIPAITIDDASYATTAGGE